ncbi:MAG: hypothetical protein ACR2FO_03920 [Actinomycetota bacterium]
MNKSGPEDEDSWRAVFRSDPFGTVHGILGALGLTIAIIIGIIWGILAGGPATWIALGASVLFAILASRLVTKR